MCLNGKYIVPFSLIQHLNEKPIVPSMRLLISNRHCLPEFPNLCWDIFLETVLIAGSSIIGDGDVPW